MSDAKTEIDTNRPVHNITKDTIQGVADLMFAPWVKELELEWLEVEKGRVLPNATVIHCARDPRDTCLSLFKNYLVSNAYVYVCDLEELGRYYNAYAALMDHWRATLPNFIYELYYHDLVSNQEVETRKLLERCGLTWDDACLDFHQTKRAVRTASAPQVRRPMYKNSVALWRVYEKQLTPLLDTLGEV
jgi:hypothetical protein